MFCDALVVYDWTLHFSLQVGMGPEKKKVLFDENSGEGESLETCAKVAWILTVVDVGYNKSSGL